MLLAIALLFLAGAGILSMLESQPASTSVTQAK
jgi:hypothetical protein